MQLMTILASFHPGDHAHTGWAETWQAHGQLLPIAGAFACACVLVGLARRRRAS